MSLNAANNVADNEFEKPTNFITRLTRFDMLTNETTFYASFKL